MTFSDDSEAEQPLAPLAPTTASRKTSCARQRPALSPKSPGSPGSTRGGSRARARRGHPGARRAGAAGGEKQRVSRGAAGKRAREERDLLRAAEEPREELEMSFEVLQVSEEEEGAPGELEGGAEGGRSWHRAVPTAATSAPRDKAPLSLPAGRTQLPRRGQERQDGSGDPPRPAGTLSSPPPAAGGEHPAWGGGGEVGD